MNDLNKRQSAFLSLEDYHYDILIYVNTMYGSLLSQNIGNQQITSATYTVLMLRFHQNERKKAFCRLPPYQE